MSAREFVVGQRLVRVRFNAGFRGNVVFRGHSAHFDSAESCANPLLVPSVTSWYPPFGKGGRGDFECTTLPGEPGNSLSSLQVPVVTVRNLPEETRRALKLRAARHGRSTEAEIRAILEDALCPETRIKIGSELAAFGQRFGGVDMDITRDQAPTELALFK